MKIICIGRNYIDHAKELNNPVPKSPLIFMKPSTALNKSKEMPYPSFTDNLHYELEVVLRIGKHASPVSKEDALSYVSGIGLGIDFTARDIQSRCKEKGHPWEKAKAFDNSASLGSIVEFKREYEKDLEFHLMLNGDKVQLGYTKDMIFDFSTLISYSSQYFTLEENDLIYTGTPAGVGSVKKGDKLIGYFNEKNLLEVSII